MDVHKKWFVCSIAFKILDIITSLYLIERDGPEIESNPFVTNMLGAYGVISGLILNGMIISVLFYILYIYGRKKLLIIATVLMALVVMVNIVTIFIG